MKIKEWIKEHTTEIAMVAGGLVTAGVAYAAYALAEKSGFKRGYEQGIIENLYDAYCSPMAENLRKGIVPAEPDTMASLAMDSDGTTVSMEFWNAAVPHSTAIITGITDKCAAESVNHALDILADNVGPDTDFSNGNIIIEFMKK